MNVIKSMIMVFNRSALFTKCCVAVSNERLEQVTCMYLYLGYIFFSNVDIDKEKDKGISTG